MLLSRSSPSVTEFAEATGWKIEPKGACQGKLCVPLGEGALDGAGDRRGDDAVVNVDLVAERLGMGVVRDEAAGLIAVGPATFAGHALTTAACPELVLPTIDGDEFDLASLAGTKVVLVAWAPY